MATDRMRLAAAIYVDAGCKPGSYRVIAEKIGMSQAAVSQMMRRPRIKSYIREMLTTQFNQLELSSQRVMQELATIAFHKASDIFDEHGDLYEPWMLPDHVAASIASVEIEKRVEFVGHPRTARTEDDPDGLGERAVGEEIVTKKYKFHSKIEALKVLAQHYKIVGGADEGVNALASALADRLKSGRKRIPTEHPQTIDEATIIEPADDYQPGASPEDVLTAAGIVTQDNSTVPQEIDDESPIW